MSAILDPEVFKKHGFTEEEIRHIEASILDFEKTGISYSHDEVFSALRKKRDQYRSEYV